MTRDVNPPFGQHVVSSLVQLEWSSSGQPTQSKVNWSSFCILDLFSENESEEEGSLFVRFVCFSSTVCLKDAQPFFWHQQQHKRNKRQEIDKEPSGDPNETGKSEVTSRNAQNKDPSEKTKEKDLFLFFCFFFLIEASQTVTRQTKGKSPSSLPLSSVLCSKRKQGCSQAKVSSLSDNIFLFSFRFRFFRSMIAHEGKYDTRREAKATELCISRWKRRRLRQSTSSWGFETLQRRPVQRRLWRTSFWATTRQTSERHKLTIHWNSSPKNCNLHWFSFVPFFLIFLSVFFFALFSLFLNRTHVSFYFELQTTEDVCQDMIQFISNSFGPKRFLEWSLRNNPELLKWRSHFFVLFFFSFFWCSPLNGNLLSLFVERI